MHCTYEYEQRSAISANSNVESKSRAGHFNKETNHESKVADYFSPIHFDLLVSIFLTSLKPSLFIG